MGVLCVQVEEEIQTLSQVLAAKEKRLAEIKRKLGITPLNELKHNITKTWQEVTTSNAYAPSDSTCLSTFFFSGPCLTSPHLSYSYRRTSETLTQAGQKATAAFSTVGSAITKKLEDVRSVRRA